MGRCPPSLNELTAYTQWDIVDTKRPPRVTLSTVGHSEQCTVTMGISCNYSDGHHVAGEG